MGTYYQTATDVTGITTPAGVTDHVKTLATSTGSQTDLTCTVAAGQSGGSDAGLVEAVFYTSAESRTWAGSYEAQYHVISVGADVTHKLLAAATPENPSSHGSFTANVLFSLGYSSATGLRSTSDTSSFSSADALRCRVSVLVQNANMMTAQSLVLRVGTTDTYATVPWSTASGPATYDEHVSFFTSGVVGGASGVVAEAHLAATIASSCTREDARTASEPVSADAGTQLSVSEQAVQLEATAVVAVVGAVAADSFVVPAPAGRLVRNGNDLRWGDSWLVWQPSAVLEEDHVALAVDSSVSCVDLLLATDVAAVAALVDLGDGGSFTATDHRQLETVAVANGADASIAVEVSALFTGSAVSCANSMTTVGAAVLVASAAVVLVDNAATTEAVVTLTSSAVAALVTQSASEQHQFGALVATGSTATGIAEDVVAVLAVSSATGMQQTTAVDEVALSVLGVVGRSDSVASSSGEAAEVSAYAVVSAVHSAVMVAQTAAVVTSGAAATSTFLAAEQRSVVSGAVVVSSGSLLAIDGSSDLWTTLLGGTDSRSASNEFLLVVAAGSTDSDLLHVTQEPRELTAFAGVLSSDDDLLFSESMLMLLTATSLISDLLVRGGGFPMLVGDRQVLEIWHGNRSVIAAVTGTA
jgi:hypothetical protein